MPDYGHDIEFGLFPTPSANDVQGVLDLVALAEVAGLDLVSVQDHPYQARYVDTWTLLSVIGARTTALRLSPNVASLPLRPPVVLAKAAATLDLITGGRVELGLGAGAFWDAIAAAGGPKRTPRQAVDALVEAIAIIRGIWAGGSLTYAGEHYQVKGLHAGPRPVHEIPIWLGAYKPRMLRVTGQLADAWVPSMGYADPAALPALRAQIDEAAEAGGRAPQAVRGIYNIFGRFGSGSGLLQGTVRDWADQLTALALDTGMSVFILGTDDPDDLRRFAGEVAPAVREQVAAERIGGQPEQLEYAAGSGDSQATVTAQVRSTPDDGVRLSDHRLWDESTRPTARDSGPPAAAGRSAAAAQHLVDIHDALRAELEQVRSVLGQVATGHLSVGAARSTINTMAMRQNNWTLGAFCQSYCRIVTGHHTLEDRSVFPHLRRREPDLAPVLDRLHDEHEVIADVLDRLDQALVGLVETDGYGRAGTDVLDDLRRQVDVLTDTLLSHLAYEERELVPALARHGFG
jgi:alkanesulfonate monooxygenase SsuD/methylene tetrahydromethanopterin reductase-like flavin-dependent oxidoreductase (luciferase family)/hemerythrin-like domain-containing protein